MDDVVKAKNSISTLSIDRLPSQAGQKGERDPEYETSNSELCAQICSSPSGQVMNVSYWIIHCLVFCIDRKKCGTN